MEEFFGFLAICFGIVTLVALVVVLFQALGA